MCEPDFLGSLNDVIENTVLKPFPDPLSLEHFLADINWSLVLITNLVVTLVQINGFYIFFAKNPEISIILLL